MKIDAYNAQMKFSQSGSGLLNVGNDVNSSRGNRAYGEAASFQKSFNIRNTALFGNYGMAGMPENGSDGKGKQGAIDISDIQNSAKGLSQNLKAICTKMDVGDMVDLDKAGADIGDMEVEKVVTVGEQIRIKLAAAGSEYVYTGDIDEADVKAVMGDEVAYAVVDKLAKYNIPLTKENVSEAAQAAELVKNMEVPDEAAAGYLMKNGLEVTIDNLYMAEHAVSEGYQESVPMEDSQWKELSLQVEKLLEENGVEAEDSVLLEFKGFVEEGIAVNEDTIGIYRQVVEARQLIEGLNSEAAGQAEICEDILAEKIAVIMVEAQEPVNASLTDEPAAWQKAGYYMEVLDNLTDDMVEAFLAENSEGGDFTLENLAQVAERISSSEPDAKENNDEISKRKISKLKPEKISSRLSSKGKVKNAKAKADKKNSLEKTPAKDSSNKSDKLGKPESQSDKTNKNNEKNSGDKSWISEKERQAFEGQNQKNKAAQDSLGSSITKKQSQAETENIHKNNFDIKALNNRDLAASQATLAESNKKDNNYVDMPVDKMTAYPAKKNTDIKEGQEAFANDVQPNPVRNTEAESYKTSNKIDFENKSQYEPEQNTDYEGITTISADEYMNISFNDTYRIPESITDLGKLSEYRKLQELRLVMTFEAAYVLEKNGIDVAIRDINKLVEDLYKLEDRYARAGLQENPSAVAGNDIVQAVGELSEDMNEQYLLNSRTEHAKGFEKVYAKFSNTMYDIHRLKQAPCDVIGQATEWNEVTFDALKESAERMRHSYEMAGRAYETMETQIRPDLGDRVYKAVEASTDNVLKELDLDNTEENRRAVRILAYNDMEVSVERMWKVKEIDKAANNLFKNLTPDIALDMIREGVDIMGTELIELNKQVEDRKRERENVSTARFSEYLYGLDRAGSISAEDREKYMALYSIINKLIKDKGNAAGQVVNQEGKATMESLLTAYLTRADAGIDVGIGDGGSQKESTGNNKLNYYKNLLSQLKEVPKEAVDMISDNNIPHTVNNLAAAGTFVKDNAFFYKEVKSKGIDASLERFLDAIDDRDGLEQCYEDLQAKVKNLIENGNPKDLSALKQLGSGMEILRSMSKNNTFYIPYDKENGTSAIKLQVVENSDYAGSFTVSMENEEYGNIQISAIVDGDNITAYIIAGAGESVAEVMNKSMENIRTALAGRGFKKTEINSSDKKSQMSIQRGKRGRVPVKRIFEAAKVFVENFR